MSAAPYSYKNLPSDTSFRVAELLPGNDIHPIECRLQTVEWSEDPQYEAISYAWGDPTDRKTVVCDGGLVSITATLHAALTHFRSGAHSRIVWADALW